MEHAPREFRVHEVAPDLRVRVTRAMPDLPAKLDDTVERLWRAAATRVTEARGMPLFNGRVFSADIITPTLIVGHMTEFRRVVAQMEEPDLFSVLKVRPLAVCGVLQCREGIIIGRRPPNAVYQPGMWQLSPAGSVDAGALLPEGWLDIRAQLLTELDEELGLRDVAMSEPQPLCVVEHPGSHVSDLGMALTIHLDADQVITAHREGGNNEYDPLRVIALDALAAFVKEAGPLLVPPARIYLARLGLLDGLERSSEAPVDQ